MEKKKHTFLSPMTRYWIENVTNKISADRSLPALNARLFWICLSIFCIVYILHLFIVFMYYPSLMYNRGGGSMCQLPDFDSFDPAVMKFITRYPALQCGHQPYLAFIDDQGYLQINQTALHIVRRTTEEVSCVYYPVTRREEDDNSITVWKQKTLEDGVPVKLEVVVVKVVCEDADERVIYHENLNYVLPPSEEMRQRNKGLVEQGRPNILLFGIDSMSRLQFIRQLPKTYNFLKNTLNVTIFKGLTRVGDNTHPNMFAFLSGLTFGAPRDDVPGPFWDTGSDKDWSARTTGVPAPVLWTNVTEQGYISMYHDDSSGHAKYNLQPTDYYTKPFYLAWELGDLHDDVELHNDGVTFGGSVRKISEVNFWSAAKYCRGNHPVQVIHFDYVERFVKKMRGSVYFAFPFLVRISHDDANSVQLIDDDLVAMLKRLHNNGDLNNTVLLVFGDHGPRFGPLRDSPIGQVEVNMPFMAVALPPALKREKPHLQAGLVSNSKRLLSWMDMHELVMDLVMDNLEAESRVERWAYNGFSPFREIPSNRTCYDAVIPTEYCVCTQPVPINTADVSVQLAAVEMMQHVNNLLSIMRPACTLLTLRGVESAELLSHPFDRVKLLRVEVRADPSDALFKGIVESNPNFDNVTVIGQVERLNKYGNQSHCIRSEPDRTLLLYCFCEDQY